MTRGDKILNQAWALLLMLGVSTLYGLAWLVTSNPRLTAENFWVFPTAALMFAGGLLSFIFGLIGVAQWADEEV